MSLALSTPQDRDAIEVFLRADLDLHLYELGDLDPFFWPRTRWVGATPRGDLAALALIYAPTLRVAALGNIATSPRARGRGLAGRVTGALCRDLQGEGVRVGLNVAVGNAAAIACYRRLGFVEVAEYEEWALGAQSAS